MTTYKNNGSKSGYVGCVAAGLQLTIMVIVIISICLIVFSGCATTKEGCPSTNWKQVEKYNGRPFRS